MAVPTKDLLTDMLSFSSVVCNLAFTALKPDCQTKPSTSYFIFDGQVDVQGNCSGQRCLQFVTPCEVPAWACLTGCNVTEDYSHFLAGPGNLRIPWGHWEARNSPKCVSIRGSADEML